MVRKSLVKDSSYYFQFHFKNRTLSRGARRGEAELAQAEEDGRPNLEEGPGEDGDAPQAGGQQGR